MVKCLPEFEYFYCILENKRNFISKIRRSKVTDYAVLSSGVKLFNFLKYILLFSKNLRLMHWVQFALLLLSFLCLVNVNVLWLFLTMPLVGL